MHCLPANGLKLHHALILCIVHNFVHYCTVPGYWVLCPTLNNICLPLNTGYSGTRQEVLTCIQATLEATKLYHGHGTWRWVRPIYPTT